MTMAIDTREAPAAVIDFRGLATAFGRRKKLIAAITGTCALLALAIALFMTPRYVSQIKILIDPRGLQILPNDLSPAAASADATFAVVESQVQVITSTEVLEKVVTKLNLTRDPEFVAGEGGDSAGSSSEGDARIRAALRTLRKRIDVRRPDRTFVLDVSVWTSSSPEKSKQIADAIAQAYLEVQVQMQTEAASRTAKALESRLSTLRQNLTNAEKQVEIYRIQNNLVGGQGNFLSEKELSDLINQLSAQRIRGAELLARMDILRKRNVTNPPIDTIAEALQSQTMFDLRARYAEAKKAETDSAVSLGPLHPAVITARAQVRQIRELIDVELARIQRSLETEYQRTKAVEGELNRQIIAARQVSASGQPPVQKLKDLENDVAAQRVVYETLQRRAKEVREEGMLDRTNSRVISPAAIQPAQYVIPRTLVVGGGFVIGLLAGIFTAAFLNQFDGGTAGVRGDRDLYERTGVFNLATVSRKAIVAASRADPAAAPVRVDGLGELPAILTQALEKSPGAILILGANDPAASCAFTLALAKQFAQRGMHALTVDATETMQLSKLLGLEGRPGFFDAMRSPVALGELEVAIGELRVLPAGARGRSESSPQTALSTQNGCALAYNGTTLIDGGAVDDQDFASLLSVVGIILVVVDANKTQYDKVLNALRTMNPYQTRLVATVLQT